MSMKNVMRVMGKPRQEREDQSSCAVCIFFTSTIFYVLLLIVVIFVAVAFGLPKLVIGGLYFHDCDIQPLLPIFLIVDACVGTLQSSCLRACKDDSEDSDKRCKFSACGVMRLLVSLFQVAWLVMGTIWVVQVRETLADPGYCKNISSPNTFPVVSSPQPIIALPHNLTDINNATFGPDTTQDKANSGYRILSAIRSSQSDAANTKSEDEKPCKTCHRVLVEFSFVVVIVQWIVVGLICIVMMLSVLSYMISMNNTFSGE